MEFTYDALRRLYETLEASGYEACGYHDWYDKKRCVILRHDIDCDPGKALDLARLENAWGGALYILRTRNLSPIQCAIT